MHVDPLMPALAAVGLVALLFGLILRRFRFPAIIGYLLAGILLGPHGLALVPDSVDLSRVGGLGVVLLLFFFGMEMRPDRLIAHWRIALGGTAVQIVVSVACVLALGTVLDWPIGRSVLLGFVISLSSTAVVLRLLRRQDEAVGEHVTVVLLAQDMAIVPMLIVVGLMGGGTLSVATLVKQAVGVVLMAGGMVFLAGKRQVKLGLGALLGDDRELQVLAALILAFGLALLTGFLELSTALGAFVGGMLVNSARETHWVHAALEPFRVVFLALFFVSIGMLLDLGFLRSHWILVATITFMALVTNTIINAAILRIWRHSWRTSLYGGALLAPIGELSYVVIAVGWQAGMVSEFAHHVTVATITLTLILSPLWILAGVRLGGDSLPLADGARSAGNGGAP